MHAPLIPLRILWEHRITRKVEKHSSEPQHLCLVLQPTICQFKEPFECIVPVESTFPSQLFGWGFFLWLLSKSLNTHIPLLWNHHLMIINMQCLCVCSAWPYGRVMAELSLRPARFRLSFHHPRLLAHWHHTQCGRITSQYLRHLEAISTSYMWWLWAHCWNIGRETLHHNSFPLPKAPQNKEQSSSLIRVCSTTKPFFF